MRLIDAYALKKSIEELKRSPWFNSVLNLSWHAGIKEALEIVETCCIDKEPTIDAVPVRHGKWIFNPSDAFEAMFAKPKCSECGFESADGGNYCPHCGARMDEE